LKKKWLILSHGFNMDGRAASLTVTDKIPYLLKAGIRPVVLSAVTGEKDVRFPHYQLLPWGPSGLRFDFRHWFANRFSRGALYKIVTPLVSFILLPFIILERALTGLSSQSSWSIPAFLRGLYLIKTHQVDLIFSSGGAWSAHLAAWWLKRVTGIPWIAEIHDPMVIRDDPKDDGTRARKKKDARFLQKLEGCICREADHVWWFTQGALDYAKNRHPQLANKGFVVLPGAEPPIAKSEHLYQNTLNICHFGSLAEDRTIAPVMQALQSLFRKYPEARSVIKIHVYGAGLDNNSQAMMTQLGFEDLLVTHGRLEHDPVSGMSGRQRVIQKMHEADVLLLLHGNYEWCAEYIPSKLYDYVWTQRPILALTNRNEFLDQLLTDYAAYICKTLEIDSITQQLEVIWQDWNMKNLRTVPFKPVKVSDAVDQILARVEGGV
jgi:glycosyltransferase involved in cell wall biosynthesis